MRINAKQVAWIMAIAGAMSAAAFAADREVKVDDRLDASADALTDMMRASDHGIPHDLIDRAHCVVVVPGMKKAGFIFGAKYGPRVCGLPAARWRGLERTGRDARGRRQCRVSDWSLGHRCCVARDE